MSAEPNRSMNDLSTLSALARDVAVIAARMDEGERVRHEMREQDDYLRQRLVFQLDELRKDVKDLTIVVYDAPNIMDRKIGEIHAEVRELAQAVRESPTMVDMKLAALRESTEEATGEAVHFVGTVRTFGLVLFKVAAVAGVITGSIMGVGKLFGWY